MMQVADIDVREFVPNHPISEQEAVGRIMALEKAKLTLDWPTNVQIEMSKVCPQACVFCPLQQTAGRMEQEEGVMPDDFFMQVVDQLAEHEPLQVMMHGSGESTVHPRFGELCQYARKKMPNTFMRVNTGGLLWKNPEKITKWLLAGFDKITFSMEANRWLQDGLDTEGKPWNDKTAREDVKQEYKRFVIHPYRAGAPWDEVAPNLILTCGILAELKAKAPSQHPVRRTQLHIQHVVSREQRAVTFTDRAGKPYRSTWEIEMSRAFWGQYGVQVQYVPIASVGGNVDNSDMMNEDFKRRPMGKCMEVFQNFTIAYDGRVSPCCQDSHTLRLLPEINVKTMGLAAAWKHHSVETLREQHRSGSGFPVQCETCLLAL